MHIDSRENAFENVVCEMASILSRPQCVKEWFGAVGQQGNTCTNTDQVLRRHIT